jgi:SPP1 family predicted phage head-tail adaptor
MRRSPSRNDQNPLAIDAGELRHSIQIQQQSSAQTGTGAPVTSWTTILQTMAKISTASSREAFQAMQFTALVSHVIKIRWPGASVAIQGGQQIVFGSRIFKLQIPENVLERNRVLLLHCLEINGAQ